MKPVYTQAEMDELFKNPLGHPLPYTFPMGCWFMMGPYTLERFEEYLRAVIKDYQKIVNKRYYAETARAVLKVLTTPLTNVPLYMDPDAHNYVWRVVKWRLSIGK